MWNSTDLNKYSIQTNKNVYKIIFQDYILPAIGAEAMIIAWYSETYCNNK